MEGEFLVDRSHTHGAHSSNIRVRMGDTPPQPLSQVIQEVDPPQRLVARIAELHLAAGRDCTVAQCISMARAAMQSGVVSTLRGMQQPDRADIIVRGAKSVGLDFFERTEDGGVKFVLPEPVARFRDEPTVPNLARAGWSLIGKGLKLKKLGLLMSIPTLHRLGGEWEQLQNESWQWGRLIRTSTNSSSGYVVWKDVINNAEVSGRTEEQAKQLFAQMLIDRRWFTLSPQEWNAAMQEGSEEGEARTAVPVESAGDNGPRRRVRPAGAQAPQRGATPTERPGGKSVVEIAVALAKSILQTSVFPSMHNVQDRAARFTQRAVDTAQQQYAQARQQFTQSPQQDDTQQQQSTTQQQAFSSPARFAQRADGNDRQSEYGGYRN
eukprot:TRINITY_DN11546_c0_g1_i2.p1 TRINITY_DN11546_c0_g1~~TRINITY_DN11546_c0_g1_i2.p1  ORF type:complete len:380 (+),score=98.52 TRINITY_DN11546_c0_g1_i2:883-2022(+)